MLTKKIIASSIVPLFLASTSIVNANNSQSTNWGSMDNGNTQGTSQGMNMYNNSHGQGMNDDSMYSLDQDDYSDDEDDLVNSDEYVIDSPKVHVGKLSLTNISRIDISGTLYVYGDMEVTNVDSFVVSGKLRVTGKLLVTNGNIKLDNGKLYVGKKSIINGKLAGKSKKVQNSLVKIDQYLRADISEEEVAEAVTVIKAADKELALLKKELLIVKKEKGDVRGVGQKMVENRMDLYAELEQYIQEEDAKAYAAIEQKDVGAVKVFYKKTTGKTDL